MVFAVHSDEGTETAAAQTIVKCAAMPQKNQSIRKIQHSCAEKIGTPSLNRTEMKNYSCVVDCWDFGWEKSIC